MNSQRLHILGIRHHGPGSARSLETALAELNPAKILVEGPPEANGLIRFVGHTQLRPPLAILVYAVQDPGHAHFYPFADYSPEWRALIWACRNAIPAEFIDLPSATRFAMAMAETRERSDQADSRQSDTAAGKSGAEDRQSDNEPDRLLARDPFHHLAVLAGYDDAEAWWNDFIEENHQGCQHFAAILEAVAELRQLAEEAEETLLREAYMRLQIHRVLDEVEGNIVVVCGAWHAPALQQLQDKTGDQKRLKKLPKTPAEATWTPWSNRHLAMASGYSAGVLSPGWYSFLWRYGKDTGLLASRWQTQVARLLRTEGLPASTAAVIEAVRLATGLAAIRGRPTPGLAEMQEASLAVLCGGNSLPLRLIWEQLIVGQDLGEVPEDVPQPPLLADLTKLIKKYRLVLEDSEKPLALDLRSEAGIAKSVLFNRLLLLDIPWAKMERNSGRGTFRENWRLYWDPMFSLRLNEAVKYGSTVNVAAQNAALEQIGQAGTISAAAQLIERCLLADLPEASDHAIKRLEALSVQGNEVAYLVDSVVPLIYILRYGTARPMPEQTLSALTLSMAREVLVRLPYATQNLDEQEAEAMVKRLEQFQQALTLLDDEPINQQWLAMLRQLEANTLCFPGIRGLCARFLYDGAHLVDEELGKHLMQIISYGVPPLDAAHWLEGFLSQTADIILVDDTLFNAIDQWLLGLSEDIFMQALPLIRRAFSGFGQSQRHRLLHKVRTGNTSTHNLADSTAEALAQGEEQFTEALPLLALILGLPTDEH